MLARKHRLTKRDNLESILKSGGKKMGKLLVVRFRKSDQNQHRLSVIISQKVAKKAADRNRIKRQIQEIVRLNYEKFDLSDYFDILILPKKAIMGATYHEIETDLLPLILQLK